MSNQNDVTGHAETPQATDKSPESIANRAISVAVVSASFVALLCLVKGGTLQSSILTTCMYDGDYNGCLTSASNWTLLIACLFIALTFHLVNAGGYLIAQECGSRHGIALSRSFIRKLRLFSGTAVVVTLLLFAALVLAFAYKAPFPGSHVLNHQTRPTEPATSFPKPKLVRCPFNEPIDPVKGVCVIPTDDNDITISI